jgi:hypothetical protein
MSEEQPDTRELRRAQARREAEERALAGSAPDEQESATHERRAEKARYLREKLEERADSEQDATGADGVAPEEASGPGADG